MAQPSHAVWHQADEECAVTEPADEKTSESRREVLCDIMGVAVNNVQQDRRRQRPPEDKRTTKAKKNKSAADGRTGQIKLAVAPGLYFESTMTKAKLVEEATAHMLILAHNASKKTVGKLLKAHYNQYHRKQVNQAIPLTKVVSLQRPRATTMQRPRATTDLQHR